MKPPTPDNYTKHADSRVNIPTQELGGFVAKEEQAPYDLLYPRDQSHGPSLSEKAVASRIGMAARQKWAWAPNRAAARKGGVRYDCTRHRP